MCCTWDTCECRALLACPGRPTALRPASPQPQTFFLSAANKKISHAKTDRAADVLFYKQARKNYHRRRSTSNVVNKLLKGKRKPAIEGAIVCCISRSHLNISRQFLVQKFNDDLQAGLFSSVNFSMLQWQFTNLQK
jgi:hypothetical protein